MEDKLTLRTWWDEQFYPRDWSRDISRFILAFKSMRSVLGILCQRTENQRWKISNSDRIHREIPRTMERRYCNQMVAVFPSESFIIKRKRKRILSWVYRRTNLLANASFASRTLGNFSPLHFLLESTNRNSLWSSLKFWKWYEAKERGISNLCLIR